MSSLPALDCQMPRKGIPDRAVPEADELGIDIQAAQPRKTPSGKLPSNPIPETLQSLKGYPNKLMIYRTPTSRFWQVRYPIGKKRLVKSTKTETKQGAITFAKTFYEELLIRQRQKLPLAGGLIRPSES